MIFSSLFSVILVATITVASPLVFERDRARPRSIVRPREGSGNHFSRSVRFDASSTQFQQAVSLSFIVFINMNLTHLFS